MKKASIALALIMAAILLFTGCGSATTSTATTPVTTTSQPVATTSVAPTTTVTTTTAAPTTPAENIKMGGTLRVLYPYSPNTIPGYPGDTTNPQKLWLCWVVFEPLVKLDINGNPTPWLATSWQFAPDYSYIDFTLRQNVKFSDGSDFNADDVVDNVNLLFQNKDAATTEWSSIEKTGDYSVRLHISTYSQDFWSNLGGWSMFFVSDTALKQGLDYVKAHPVGTGPFIFQSFEKDVKMTVTKNPNYWQAGKPYLDEIDFITVTDQLTQESMLEAHEGDVLVLQTGKILQDMTNEGLDVITQAGNSNFLMFDTANDGEPTNDPRVREAIDYALDKQAIADALGYGFMFTNNQIPTSTNPAYDSNLATRQYDPDKARQLLADAGYAKGLTLTLISETDGQDFAVMVQQYLQLVGINLKLEMVDNAKLWNYLFTGWHGIMSASYNMGINLPMFVRNYFPPIGVFDVSVKIPQDVLDSCAAAMVETDPTKFKADSDNISQWIWDNDFFVPTVGVAMGYIQDKSVKDADFLLKYFDFSMWSPENTWLDR